VVDDEPCGRALSPLLLSRFLGLRVIATDESEEAIRLIRQSQPDLILSDLVRAGMDGLEFTRQVRRFHPEIPLLLLAGNLGGDLAAPAQAAGATACLPKPIPVPAVLRWVWSILNRPLRSGPISGAVAGASRPSGFIAGRQPFAAGR